MYEPKFGAYVTKIVCIELQGKNEKQKTKKKKRWTEKKKYIKKLWTGNVIYKQTYL